MYFIEIHHAIGQPIDAPLSAYKWEQYPLGGGYDDGFLDVDGPAVTDVIQRLLTRRDVVGVRVVFHPEPATIPRTFHDVTPAEGGPPATVPADGQVMATHVR